MACKHGENNTIAPTNSAPWTDIPLASNSFIPVPAVEFSEDNHFFCDLGSIPSSDADADATSTSNHSDSSGFLEAHHHDLAMLEKSHTATSNSIPNQVEASTECVNPTMVSVQNHDQVNSYSDRLSSFSYDVLHQDLFLEIPNDESALQGGTGSDEWNQNCDGSYPTGFDELAKTISENCSIDDLMNLPLEESILQSENHMQGESHLFPGQLKTLPRSGNKLRNYNCPTGLSSDYTSNPNEVYEDDFPQDNTTINAANSRPCGSNQELPMKQTFASKCGNPQNFPEELEMCSLDLVNDSPSIELISKRSFGSQNPSPLGYYGKNSANTISSTYQQENLSSQGMKSIPVLAPNTSSICIPTGSISTELMTNQTFTAKKQVHNSKGNKNMELNHSISSPKTQVYNRKGNKNMELNHSISTHDNSEKVVKETKNITQEISSQAQNVEDSRANKVPILKFKRVPKSKEFYVCTNPSTEAANLAKSQDGEADYPNYSFGQHQKKALLSISSPACDGINEDLSSASPASSGPASKICGVCGDLAKSMHFGGMACDSCKAFFRRSVQGKYWKKFHCSLNKSCKVRKSNRRSCQFCRFAKCRKNGMKISWVMTEEERLVLWKKRLTKNHQDENDEHMNSLLGTMNHFSSVNRKYSESVSSQKNNCDYEDRFIHFVESREKRPCRHELKGLTCKCQRTSRKSEHHPWLPSPSLILVLAGGGRLVPDTSIHGTSVNMCSEGHPLSDGDCVTINKLIASQNSVFSRYSFTKACEGNTVESIHRVHINICEQLSSYYRENEDLLLFSRADQVLLCRNRFLTSLVIHSLYNFDDSSKSWPRESCINAIKTPYISFDTLARFINSSYATETFINFCLYYNRDVQDEGILAIMLILNVVYEVESPHELENEMLASECREKYLHLLIRYLRFRQGERGYIVTLPRLLAIMSEAKKFSTLSRLAKLDMSSTVHNAKHMLKTVELVQDMITRPLPPYSSVMTSGGCGADGSKIDKAELHHPLTKAIFGPTTQGNNLLLDPFEQMLRYENDKLEPAEQNPHLANSEEKLRRFLRSSKEETALEIRDEQQNADSGVDMDIDVDENATQSATDSNSMCSDEKKVGVQVLCEMLQSIVQNNDSTTKELLCKSLPSEFIEYLTSKSNKKSLVGRSNP